MRKPAAKGKGIDMKKLLCIILTLIFALTAAGCGNVSCDISHEEKPEVTEALQTERATEKPAESAVPGPTAAPDPEANTAFEQLDGELFREYLSSGYETYNQFIVSDGARFGVDPDELDLGWGEFTYEAHMGSMDEARETLEKLAAIDPAALNEGNRHAYEAIKRAFEVQLMYEDYYYYDEPLKPMNGLQTLIPLTVVLFNIRTLKDVEAYMYLVEDIERLFGQIGDFEEEKAARGLFMCETALDQVIDSLRSFAAKGGNSFLITCFDDVVKKAAELGMSSDECSELTRRNTETVLQHVLPAYARLADLLESHRKDCTEFTGAANRSDKERAYFELAARDEGATMADMDTVVSLVEEMGESTYRELCLTVMYGGDALLDKYGESLGLGSFDENTAWLKDFAARWYPAIPEYSLKTIDVPEDIADEFSPAAYLTPAFDDYYDNVILINRAAEGSDDVFTIAHETIPGHMLQFLTARNTPGMSLTQQALEPTGYAEAWTVFAERFISTRCPEVGLNYGTMMSCENVLCNIFLPAYISIMVNREGWSFNEVEAYLREINMDDAADIYYEYAVTMPYYAMSYAIGYAYLFKIYNNAAPDTPEDHREFFQRYLGFGPTYMDIMLEYMSE